MSNFTTQLRYICEWLARDYGEDVDLDDIESVIDAARVKIFDFDYPYIDSTTKADIECDILREFYFREIAYETYGRWKLALHCKMLDIMPYYNKMIETAQFDYNIVLPTTSKMTVNENEVGNNSETISGNNSLNKVSNNRETENDENSAFTSSNAIGKENTTNSRSNTDTVTTTNKFSDTPQNSIGNLETYMSEATINNRSDISSGSDTSAKNIDNVGSISENGTDKIEKENLSNTYENGNYGKTRNDVHNIGKTNVTEIQSTAGKTPAELVEMYRKTVMRIHEMIMRELKPLFIGLWE